MPSPDARLPFFDTHAHLNLLPPELPADAAFQGARERGLEGLVNIGTRIASSRESVDLAARLPNVWATVGIHPFEAATLTPESLGELRDLAASPRVVGIGETGIDRADFAESPLEVQAASLRAHIALARERGLPLILHCREAFAPLFSLLDSESLPDRRGVFHCFTGSRTEAFGALDRGFYLSFSGIVTLRTRRPFGSSFRSFRRTGSSWRPIAPIWLPFPTAARPTSPPIFPKPSKSAPNPGARTRKPFPAGSWTIPGSSSPSISRQGASLPRKERPWPAS